jgi:hypothetical protein
VSQSFGYTPKSGIAGSNGRSMSSFLSTGKWFLTGDDFAPVEFGKVCRYFGCY